MFTKEQDDYLGNLDADGLCGVCSHRFDCNGFHSDGNGNPVFPYCTEHDYEDYVDKELLEGQWKIEKEVGGNPKRDTIQNRR